MIFVPCDQFANHLCMMLFGPKLLPCFMWPAIGKYCYKVQMQSDCRYFIDDHKSFTVRQTHKLLRIRVVRGAEGVGTNPFQQIQVFHIEHFIQSTPVDMGVLMSSKS